MHPFVIPALLLAAALGVAVVVVIVNSIQERKRSEAFAELASALSFDFSPLDQPELRTALSGFHLFSQGHTKKLWNLLRGVANGLEICIFDYRYVTGSGKQRHTWVQSVFCARRAGMDLPTFCMRPESIWHKIGKWFGNDDINFDSHPTFSSAYLLRGVSKLRIRELFTENVLAYFESARGLNVEGDSDTLIYYKYNRLRPERVREFMAEGFEILELLARPEATGNTPSAP